jgi:GT2 family glycosyltransferase/glycosyltransferase involved in cell wall biosynthesis
LKLITESRGGGLRITFHLHWLNPIVSPANGADEAKEFVDLFLAKLQLFKALGGRILWTLHNIVSHEPKYLAEEVRLTKGVVDLADWIHVHHLEAARMTEPYYRLPSEKLVLAEHGNYVGVLPDFVNRVEARRKFGIPDDATVFLFLGQVRSYKGIDDLISAFCKVATDQNCWLIIAGKLLGINQAELVRKIKNIPNIIFRPGFIPDEEMQFFLKCSDVMVLPYKSVLTSGSMLLAMSYGLPVVCPNIDTLRAVINDSKNGFIYEGNELSNALRRCLEIGNAELGRVGERALQTAQSYRWETASFKLQRHLEGLDFGVPVCTQLSDFRRLWFVRGDLTALREKKCLAIVLHYRGVDDTVACLNALSSQGNDVGIIVISNNESFDDVRELARLYPDLIVVQSEENVGYAAANNFGLWLCRQNEVGFFWILNPDVVVPVGYYKAMMARMETYVAYDFFGSTLVSGDDSDKVLFCGGEIRLTEGARPGHLYLGASRKDLPDKSFECDYLTGANIFGRVSALPRAGYLPETYFLYFEETEWFLKFVMNGGKKPLVFPDIVAVNFKKSAQNGLPQRYYLYYFCRNFLLFGEKFSLDGAGQIKIEARKFANAWLEKIARRAPEKLIEFESLVDQAFRDAESRVTGKSPLV